MSAETPNLRIVRRPLDHPDARRLVDEVQGEYALLYGTPDHSPVDVSEFADPSGAFFVAHLPDGELVGTVGWRWVPTPAALGDGDERPVTDEDVERRPATRQPRTAEMKRMFVRRPYRRQGLSRVLLAWVEESAREAGARWLVLETGLLQPEAIALYESAGYRPLEGFGFYATQDLARAFAKELTTGPT